ncbi:hypothetical protein F5Y18DRAFT_340823 [Xylariaceae sp. FL1019]|nr:hypothetical protein F5Y18DRAFT_340823 [Xylariaceae sp. FL1019]
MSDQAPLLEHSSDHDDQAEPSHADTSTHIQHARRITQKFFASPARHWAILALIVLDVAGILTDIFIALITCELKREREPWVTPTRDALTTFSLVMSCIFMVELALSIFADGLEFFSNWFHCLDAFVIVGSFVVDLLEHGLAEEIASLIVVLRLWRFVKIIQEFSVEQSEQTEALYKRIEDLEKQLFDHAVQRET